LSEVDINYSINDGKLKLSLINKIDHYWISILFGFMPLIVFVLSIKDSASFDNSRLFLIMLFCFPISLVTFFLQKNKLKIKSVETNLSNEEIVKKIENLAIELNWELINKKRNYFLYVTNPKFTSGSWGEQITIFTNEKNVYVNSICDLNKRTSIVSMGKNHKNEQAIIKSFSIS
jgi:hypothetical protein